MWWQIIGSAAAALVLLWLLLLAVLWRSKPEGLPARDLLRLLPDVLRLLPRLARDPAISRGVRWRLWAALAYLALPVDLVPDVIPVLGYADDVIVVAAVLRSVVRSAGPEVLARHWPGNQEGLAALTALARLA